MKGNANQDLIVTGAARFVVVEETESPCPVEDGLFSGEVNVFA